MIPPNTRYGQGLYGPGYDPSRYQQELHYKSGYIPEVENVYNHQFHSAIAQSSRPRCVVDMRYSTFFVNFPMHDYITLEYYPEVIDLAPIIKLYRNMNITKIIGVIKVNNKYKTFSLLKTSIGDGMFYQQDNCDTSAIWSFTSDILQMNKMPIDSINFVYHPSDKSIYYDFNNNEIIINREEAKLPNLIEYVQDAVYNRPYEYVFFKGFKYNVRDLYSYVDDHNYDTGVVYIDLPNHLYKVIEEPYPNPPRRALDYVKAFNNTNEAIRTLGYNALKVINRSIRMNILYGEKCVDNSEYRDHVFFPKDTQLAMEALIK